MEFNYTVLDNVKNDDFVKTKKNGLLERCKGLAKKVQDENWVSIDVEIRIIMENLLKYLYSRLMEVQETDIKLRLDQLIDDPSFNNKIGADNTKILVKAGNIRRNGNAGAHEDGVGSASVEVINSRNKSIAGEMIPNLEILLKLIIEYIDTNLSYERGRVELKLEENISADTGKIEKRIVAKLIDVANRKDYKLSWGIKNGASINAIDARGNYLFFKDWMKGKTIVVEAVNELLGQKLRAEYKVTNNGEFPSKTGRESEKKISEKIAPKRKAPQGKLVISKDRINKSGDLVLQVHLENAEFKLEDQDVLFAWGFILPNKAFHKLTGPKTDHSNFICKPDKSKNQTFRCQVFCTGYEQPLEADFGPITETDFLVKAGISDEEITDHPTSLSQISEGKELEEKPKENVLNPLVKMKVGLKQIQAPEFNCFDSKSGRIHYFVTNRKDKYATNTYQILDFERYIHLLLKEQGYECVVVLSDASEGKRTVYRMLVYDAISEASLEEEFRLKINEWKVARTYVNIHECFVQYRSEQVGKSPDLLDVSNKTTTFLPKRVLNTIEATTKDFGTADAGITFKALPKQFIIPLMKQEAIKTAIVIPQELMRRGDFINSLVSEVFCNLLLVQGENILIVTADTISDLEELYSFDKFRKLEREQFLRVGEIDSTDEKEQVNLIMTKELVASQRLIVALDVPNVDEIMNYLSSLKVSNYNKVAKLSYAEISLISHEIFKRLKAENGNPGLNLYNCIVELEEKLQDESYHEDLLKKAGGLQGQLICPKTNFKATCIKRIYAAVKK
jgi:hypothetical protein